MEKSGSIIIPNKKPRRRKYHRRPRQLTEKYERIRSSNHARIETHIWHPNKRQVFHKSKTLLIINIEIHKIFLD